MAHLVLNQLYNVVEMAYEDTFVKFLSVTPSMFTFFELSRY